MSILDRLKAISDLALGRSAVRIDSATKQFSQVSPVAPGVKLPRVAGISPTAHPDNPVIQAVNSVDALFGRVSYGAGPSFTRYSSYPAEALSPAKIKAILHECDLGLPLRMAELCEQVLERDGHLYGVDRARRVEVSGKPFFVHARNETPLAASLAKFVKAVVDEIDDFDHSIEDLLSANGQGYSCSEIVWSFKSIRFPAADGTFKTCQILAPVKLDFLHPKHIMFDQLTDEPYLVLSTGNLRLPPAKFVFHAATGTGLIERRGYMRSCLYLHCAKQMSLRDWLVFSHIFGIPQIEAVYDGEISLQDAQRTLYENMLVDFGQGIPAIHPRDLELRITQATSGGTATDVHGAIIGWCNAEISKAVTGSTLTVEMGGVGSYNAGSIHADVRHAFVQADARKLATTLRSDLFLPILELNLDCLMNTLGVSEEEIRNSIPVMAWRIDRETSPMDRASIVSKAINEWGLAIDEEQQRADFGLDAPRPGSQPLAGSAIHISSGGKAVGSLEVSEKGVEAPKEETPAPTKAPPKTQAKTRKPRKRSS